MNYEEFLNKVMESDLSKNTNDGIDLYVGVDVDTNELVMHKLACNGIIVGNFDDARINYLCTLINTESHVFSDSDLKIYVVNLCSDSESKKLKDLVLSFKHTIGYSDNLKDAVSSLNDVIRLINQRLKKLQDNLCVNLSMYNEYVSPLPRILVVIEGFAYIGRRCNEFMKILRYICSKGKAVGIHILLSDFDDKCNYFKEYKEIIEYFIDTRIVFRCSEATSKHLIGDWCASANIGKGFYLYDTHSKNTCKYQYVQVINI